MKTSRRGFFQAVAAIAASVPLVKKLVPKGSRYVAMDIGPEASKTGIYFARVGHSSKYDTQFLRAQVAQDAVRKINGLDPHQREYWVTDSYLYQSMEAEKDMEKLTAWLRKAGFEPMGDGPLADCWVPTVRYEPGDIISIDIEG